MSNSFRLVSTLGLCLALTFSVLGTTGARAQDPQVQVNDAPYAPPVTIDPKTVTNDATPIDPGSGTAADGTSDADISMSPAASLAELVATVPVPASLSPDIECMAVAIYFEAKSESLAGQLAVGRVIVARTASGRFPGSYCGVVMQHAQFSFVRGGALPALDRSNRSWQSAVRVALVADHGAWKSPAEGALFFHAARVGAVAGKTRVARIDNHVFYR